LQASRFTPETAAAARAAKLAKERTTKEPVVPTTAVPGSGAKETTHASTRAGGAPSLVAARVSGATPAMSAEVIAAKPSAAKPSAAKPAAEKAVSSKQSGVVTADGNDGKAQGAKPRSAAEVKPVVRTAPTPTPTSMPTSTPVATKPSKSKSTADAKVADAKVADAKGAGESAKPAPLPAHAEADAEPIDPSHPFRAASRVRSV
jgi:hypothetical protein